MRYRFDVFAVVCIFGQHVGFSAALLLLIVTLCGLVGGILYGGTVGTDMAADLKTYFISVVLLVASSHILYQFSIH